MSESRVFDAEDVAHRAFSTAFRGFDQQEVRAHLAELAAALADARAREQRLEARLAAAEAAAAPRALTAAELEEALGAETAKVLHAARVAAAEIRGRTEEQVGRMLREATAESTRLRQEAAAITGASRTEAESAAAAIVGDAERAAATVREQAEAEAAATTAAAKERGREVLAEAKALRDRILGDLDRRRREALAELAQLQAARDRMLEGCRAVQAALDAATAELVATGPDAPAPAAAASVAASAAVADAPEVDGVEAAPPAVAGREHEEATPVAEAMAVLAGGAEPDVEPVPGAVPASAGSGVDDVLARFRADREATVARATEVLAGARTTSAAPPQVRAAPPAAPQVRSAPEEAADDGEDGAAVGDAERPVPPVPSPAVVDPAATALVAAFERRDAALEPHERTLTRALKRALADEQNELLDALRRARGARTLDVLVAPAAARVRRLQEVAVERLVAAAAAGMGEADADAAGVGAEAAARLGQDLAGGLGQRLERVLDAAGDDAEVGEVVSAAYREWRSSRVEPLVRHHVLAAWSAGAHAAGTGERTWVVDPDTGCSPDCADNTLAGPTPRDEPFPTGHLHPPAHPGCRCLVVAAGN